MAQDELVILTVNGKKLVIVTGIAGPASYATGGLTVTVNSLRNIEKVLAVQPTTGRTTADINARYEAQSPTDNTFKVKSMEQTVTAAASSATWAETAATTNLSTVIFTAIVVGN